LTKEKKNGVITNHENISLQCSVSQFQFSGPSSQKMSLYLTLSSWWVESGLMINLSKHCKKNVFEICYHNIFFFCQINLNNLFSSANLLFGVSDD